VEVAQLIVTNLQIMTSKDWEVQTRMEMVLAKRLQLTNTKVTKELHLISIISFIRVPREHHRNLLGDK
jgi:hypothetical protein